MAASTKGYRHGGRVLMKDKQARGLKSQPVPQTFTQEVGMGTSSGRRNTAPSANYSNAEQVRQSTLALILRQYADSCRHSPDALGEILRAWAFVGEGFGCYSTFEVRPEFNLVEAGPREFRFLWGRDYRRGDTKKNSWGYCDADALKEISWYAHPCGIEMGWHWDGDGNLAFYVPELEDKHYDGSLHNSDCKKNYDWKFGERRARS